MEEVLPDTAPVPRETVPGRPGQEVILSRLGQRSIVLVGLMGAGKSTIGRRLAAKLGMPFRDADQEIETAAAMPISDIFAQFGESAFRDGERRVIARLLAGDRMVLATGGGAFMNPDTRARIAERGLSVWLRADHPTLMRRVRRRATRPLLKTANPEDTMRRLMAERYPVYGLADVTIDSFDGSHDAVAEAVVTAIAAHVAEWDRRD